MRATARSLALGLALLACARPVPEPEEGTKQEATEAELALPFVENDYAQALAEARSRKVPLFVEAWAPW